MADGTLSVEDLLQIDENINNPESLTVEDLLKIDSEQEQPTAPEKPSVFTSDQYYDGPEGSAGAVLVDADEFTDKEKNNWIFQSLRVSVDGFDDMDLKEQRKLFANAIYRANEQIYKQQGQESVIPGMRTQQGVDEDGEPANYVVPTPMTAYYTGTPRALAGGVLEAGKGIARVGEGVTDFLGITDPETDYMKENFPTLPPENKFEAVGQEVVSILTGSLTGVGLASKLEKAYGIAPKTAKYLANKWGSIRNKKPEDLASAAQVFAKTFILGTGANIGATVTTPEQSDPLFGDDVVEFLGFDPDENRNLTNFADNVAFSTFLMGLGKSAKAAWPYLKPLNPFRFKKPNRDLDVGATMFKLLDPALEDNVPAQVFAERAKILGEVVQNNKTFASGLLESGEISTDTTTALLMGAKDYFRRAYGWQRSYMDEEAFEKFVNANASEMVNRMAQLRRARRTGSSGSEAIARSEAQMDADMAQAFQGTADAIDPNVTKTQGAGEALATPVIDELGTAKQATENTAALVEVAKTGLDSTQSKNFVTDLIKQNRENVLASSKASNDTLDRLTGEQLYDTWRNSYNKYTQAFKNLPDIPLPVDEFVQIVERAYPDVKQWPNIIDSVTMTNTVQDPIGDLMRLVTPQSATNSAGEVVTETYPEMISRLSNTNPPVSFKQVYTQLRPLLTERIGTLIEDGAGIQARQLIDLKNGIDEIAETIGDPAFIQAKNMYAEHADTWLNIPALAQFETAARDVVPDLAGSSGVPKGMPNVETVGRNARQQALEGGTPLNRKGFARALDPATATPDLAMAYIADSINAIRLGMGVGQAPDSQAIIAGLQKNKDLLQELAPDAYAKLQQVVSDLGMAEAGLLSAKEQQTAAELAYAQIKSDAGKDAASRFIFDLTGNPEVRDNAAAAMNEIFRSADSTNIVRRLLQRADESGNPLIREGIQAQYLRWLQNNLRTARRTGMSPLDPTEATRGISSAQLDKLADPANPFINTVSEIFSDNPDRAAQIFRLIEIQDMIATGRSVIPDYAGSPTAFNQQASKMLDRFITLGFGVLNPTATMVRNISKAVLEQNIKEMQEASEATFNMMIAYPEKFDEIMQLLSKGNEESALNEMSKHFGRAAYGSSSQSYDVYQQTEDSLPVE